MASSARAFEEAEIQPQMNTDQRYETVITMERDIAERDWKVFKELHSVSMDRFFEKAVKEMLLTEEELSRFSPEMQERLRMFADLRERH